VAIWRFVFENSTIKLLFRVMRVMHFVCLTDIVRFFAEQLPWEDFLSSERFSESCRKLKSHSTRMLTTRLAVFADYLNLLSVPDFIAYL